MAPVAPQRRTFLLPRHRKWCFCVDFRVGTIALAVCQIMVHLACMAFLMAVFIRPSLVHDLVQQIHHMEHYQTNDAPPQPPAQPMPQQGSSMAHTFHMLIFGSQQTVFAKDKDGKVHLTRMYEPLLVAAIPQEPEGDKDQSHNGRIVASNPRFVMKQAATSGDVAVNIQQEETVVSQDRVPHIRRYEAQQSSEDSQPQEHYELSCYHKGHHALALLCLWLSLCVCCCLLYGASMRRPWFLLPYLGVQIACFIFYLLALIHSLSYVPNLKFWVAHKTHLPFKRHLMQLSELHLTLLFTGVSLSILLVKMNLLLLVWGCYRMLRMEQIQQAIARIQQQRAAANAASNNGAAVNVVIDVPALVFLEEKNDDLAKDEQPPSYFPKTEEEKPAVEEKEADDAPLLSA